MAERVNESVKTGLEAMEGLKRGGLGATKVVVEVREGKAESVSMSSWGGDRVTGLGEGTEGNGSGAPSSSCLFWRSAAARAMAEDK